MDGIGFSSNDECPPGCEPLLDNHGKHVVMFGKPMWQPKKPERREAILQLQSDVWLDFLREGFPGSVCVESTVPSDARVLRVDFDSHSGMIFLLLWSCEFAVVGEGRTAPYLPSPQYRKRFGPLPEPSRC